MSIIISSINTLGHEAGIDQQLARELRRADDFIKLAVMSVYKSMASCYPIDAHEATDWGLIVSTSFGPMEINFAVLDQIVSQEQTSPTLFSHSVFNAAAGYLTRIFNISGNTITLTDFYYPFFQALDQAINLINTGQVKRCFVLQVETYSRLLEDARTKENQPDEKVWPMGCVAWLIEHSQETTNQPKIQSLTIRLSSERDTTPFTTADTITCNGKEHALTHPLMAPFSISNTLREDRETQGHHFQISGDSGTIELEII